MYFVMPLALVALIMIPLYVGYRQFKSGKKLSHVKKAVLFNLVAFGIVCLANVVLPLGGFVSAASVTQGSGLGYLGAALSTGLAAVGAGIAVSGGASAAIGATTEDPSALGRALIFVGLGEGIALYGLIISIMILSRV